MIHTTLSWCEACYLDPELSVSSKRINNPLDDGRWDPVEHDLDLDRSDVWDKIRRNERINGIPFDDLDPFTAGIWSFYEVEWLLIGIDRDILYRSERPVEPIRDENEVIVLLRVNRCSQNLIIGEWERLSERLSDSPPHRG